MYGTQNVVLECSELVDLSRNIPSLAQNFVSMGKCMESYSGRHSRYPPISTSDGDTSDNTHLRNRHCFILLHLVDTVHGVVVCNMWDHSSFEGGTSFFSSHPHRWRSQTRVTHNAIQLINTFPQTEWSHTGATRFHAIRRDDHCALVAWMQCFNEPNVITLHCMAPVTSNITIHCLLRSIGFRQNKNNLLSVCFIDLRFKYLIRAYELTSFSLQSLSM